jgi:hypothetical protein
MFMLLKLVKDFVSSVFEQDTAYKRKLFLKNFIDFCERPEKPLGLSSS